VSRRRLLIAGSLVVLLVGAAIGIYAYNQSQPTEKRGSASQEFDTNAAPKPPRASRRTKVPWPTYGFDQGRQHVAPYRLKPPFHRLWRVDGHDTLEFPPTIGYGRLFLAQQKGLFYALDVDSGRVDWMKKTGRCAASSPAIGKVVVYASYMDKVNCPQGAAAPTGFVIAWGARSGRKLWKYKGQPFESSPLLWRNTVYVGSWDHRLHAINAKTGHRRWTFEADDRLNTSPARWRSTIYIASNGGSLYAVNAKTGKLRWSAQSHSSFGSREFFYATPTVAYGRVFIGNSDGTMYVYGAKSGKLLWARPLGTYIYSAAAVWKRRVFVGTYDGKLYSLDAATGDVIWQKSTAAAVHSAPTVMNGIVYYATCSSCGRMASRSVKAGPDGTWGADARTGHGRWHFAAGKFASPVVSDGKRIFVTGRAQQFALEPKRDYLKRKQARAAAKAKRAREKRKKG
jgi:outer membrane protein assembly factor BamB